MQDVLHPQQLFPLPLHQAADGDVGPAAHDFSNLLIGDLIPQEAGPVVSSLAGLRLLFLLRQALLELRQAAVFQLGGPIEVVLPLGLFNIRVHRLQLLPQLLDALDGGFFILPPGLHRRKLGPHIRQLLLKLQEMLLGELVAFLLQGGLLNLMLHDAAVDLVQLGGHGIHLGADHGAGFVDKVDSLIRQKAVADVPVREDGGGDEGLVGNLHPVVHLVPLLEAPEDGDGILHRRLRNQHRLEPPLQGGVLFDVLAVFVEGGGPDAMELPTGQQRL